MINRLQKHYGPVALVTGASDGIGRAFAIELAAAGLDLVLVARRGDRLDALSVDLAARHGISCTVHAADLSVPGAVATLVDALKDVEVGLLVAAAGFGTGGSFLNTAIADQLEMIDVNCRSVVDLVHAMGDRMVAKRRGGIVLLSSLVAFQGVPRAACYAATKAFMQTFAEGIGSELQGQGVDVLAVAPGPVASGFGARAGMDLGSAASPETIARGALRVLGKRRTSRPGVLATVLELALAPLPRRGRTRIMGAIMTGMTRPSEAVKRNQSRAMQASTRYGLVGIGALALLSIVQWIRSKHFPMAPWGKYLLGVGPNFAAAIAISFVGLSIWASQKGLNEDVLAVRYRFIICASISLIGLVGWEFIQGINHRLVFDPQDILATFVGIGMAAVLFSVVTPRTVDISEPSRRGILDHGSLRRES
jgi:short-subunit dehydrogenase